MCGTAKETADPRPRPVRFPFPFLLSFPNVFPVSRGGLRAASPAAAYENKPRLSAKTRPQAARERIPGFMWQSVSGLFARRPE